ncbi:ubiquitin-associated protein 2 isoform X4 [Cebus imitator]|uniref:ubiquitin-associated protein 2 isoform X4 n=2 Tax=Cebus imitator TaxID=2715852 RepID=UPI000809FD2C|nr:ubiquitin-associated protein 2 isoform X4 [Cebus imitator]XP_037599561.1 ubiquitin-associated protein 2 isoform X4 [Cebus imitator]
MMTSMSSDHCRGAREKPQISAQSVQPQKQVAQATAEQMRLAQVIFDKNDSDFEAKVKQLMEVTGKNQDECIVALHDCNGDVNKAINILLEGNSDTTSWETVVGKKKNFAKENSENKENREKKSEKESVRGRGNNNRKGRGGNRGREFRGEENGIDSNQVDRPSDRGKRVRGRELASNSHNIAQDLPNKSSYGLKGAWKNSVEEWTTEDWTEDLSETKVFTASSAPAENHISPGQSIDLVALLQKPVPHSQASEASSFETSQQQGFGQALVFTNSQHNNQMAPGTGSSTAVNTYSPQSLSSVLGSGFGELAPPKMANITSSQILDQMKAPSLGQFTTTPSTQQNSASHPATTTSWDLKPPTSQPSVLSHFDFKSQPEPSPVLSQLSQRQQHQSQAVTVPPPGLESFTSQAKRRESTPGDSPSTVNKLLQLPSMTIENISVSAHQPQPKHIKLAKRRIPPASKIPASAVEMPGSADVTGLNVQFGALEFGSEPSLSEFGSAPSTENSNQIPISLYSKSLSEPLNTSLPMTSAVQNSTYTTSVITSCSLTSSLLSSASPVATSSSYDQSSVHGRIPYQSPVSPSESAPGTIMNGHGGGQSQQTLDTPKTAGPPSALPSGSSLPSTTSCAALLPSTSQHTGNLSGSPLSQLSSSLSSHQSSLSSAHTVLSSSTSHTHASVENAPSLQSSATFSTAATSTSSSASSGTSLSSSMHTANSLCLGGTPTSASSSSTRAVPLVTSGKAPPNLPQGVPPLLHNQYLVGPGGLLPAYPIYGYDELQMLQSRLPVDYYGIPFAAPTALASRDGSLANNPYPGDVTKFGRGDSASPAPPTTPAQPQQSQSQTHHTAQQPFLNPALPPGYSYTGLPYYTGVPSAFQYGPTMFVPPASAKQHGVNLSAPTPPFQQASGYGQHGYSTGYDDLTQGTAAGDYTKGGYGGPSQAPNKSAGSGPGKGVSVSSSTTGLPDMTGSVYNKTQTFDKQGFHAGTPPPFSLPSALGSTGPLAPGAAPGYAPPPFLHILPAHQQPHSQLLHHHLPQDAQSGSGQRSQPSSLQPKSQASKPAYGNSPYWTN